MSLMRFRLKTLDDLDPRVSAAFDRAIQTAVLDCRERAADKKPRRVTLEMEIVPQLDDSDGGCSHAEANFRIKCKVPERRSRNYSLMVEQRGGLLFSDGSPSNVDQLTFDEADAEGKARRPKPPEE